MSRIGKHPVQIPAGVTATVEGHTVQVKGPKGELERTFSPLIELIQDGDAIQPWCDYYTYNGEYDGAYYYGDPITVSGDIRVTYDDIGDNATAVCYMLVDIYGNNYWTEMVYYD